MINKKRVNRIKNVIYTAIALIVLIPAIFLITMGIKLLQNLTGFEGTPQPPVQPQISRTQSAPAPPQALNLQDAESQSPVSQSPPDNHSLLENDESFTADDFVTGSDPQPGTTGEAPAPQNDGDGSAGANPYITSNDISDINYTNETNPENNSEVSYGGYSAPPVENNDGTPGQQINSGNPPHVGIPPYGNEKSPDTGVPKKGWR